jgi:hypothetical protein
MSTSNRRSGRRPNWRLIAAAAVMIAWTVLDVRAVAYVVAGVAVAWLVGDAVAFVLARRPTVTLRNPWRAARPRPVRRS